MRLKGKVAIVTGTSPNIGGGIADILAVEGAIIAAIDAKAENAMDCARSIREAGGHAKGFACDVADEEQVRAVVDGAFGAFGRIDILVNCAGYYNWKGVLDMPLEEWRNQIAVLLDGAFLFTKYAAARMIERREGGNIINIISTAGHQGEPNNIAYGTAKSGLINFTRSTAMELAKYGIRVNSVTPTATDPGEAIDRAERWGRDVVRGELDPRLAFAASQLPLQRLPRPSDYGRAVAFLASDDAEMITGIDIRVDAGAVAKYWVWNPGKDKAW